MRTIAFAAVLGFADLAFMSTTARLKCPFTSLGVAPEAASSYLLPRLLGRQDAAWVLLSAEWISAEEAREMGLVNKVVPADQLLAEVQVDKVAAEVVAPADVRQADTDGSEAGAEDSESPAPRRPRAAAAKRARSSSREDA